MKSYFEKQLKDFCFQSWGGNIFECSGGLEGVKQAAWRCHPNSTELEFEALDSNPRSCLDQLWGLRQVAEPFWASIPLSMKRGTNNSASRIGLS